MALDFGGAEGRGRAGLMMGGGTCANNSEPPPSLIWIVPTRFVTADSWKPAVATVGEVMHGSRHGIISGLSISCTAGG